MIQIHHKIYAAIGLLFVGISAFPTYFVCIFLHQATATARAAELATGEIKTQIASNGAASARSITALPATFQGIADRAVKEIVVKTDAQITGLRGDLFGRAGNGGAVGALRDAAVGVVNARGDAFDGVVAAALTDKDTGLVAPARALLAKYSLIPDEFAAEVRPAWLSLQSEITCRDVNGNGYGGCMRSRINGMLGEGEKSGAVFTQQFPDFAKAVTESTKHFDHVADHYDRVLTGPTTLKGKILSGLEIALGIGRVAATAK